MEWIYRLPETTRSDVQSFSALAKTAIFVDNKSLFNIFYVDDVVGGRFRNPGLSSRMAFHDPCLDPLTFLSIFLDN